MDQQPRGNGGFTNSNLFADSQQFNAYDSLFPSGTDQNFSDASWGLNASQYPVPSRGQNASAPSWPQNANHLSAQSPHQQVNGQVPPYARSLSHSPAPFGQNAFNGYGAQQNFQYRQQSQYDPALVTQPAFGQNFHSYSTTDYQVPNAGTIAPHALEHDARSTAFGGASYNSSEHTKNPVGRPRLARPEIVSQAVLTSGIPNGYNAGYFSIINYDNLARATNSERMGNFVNIGMEALNLDVNRAALPVYVPRKSRKELRRVAGNDPKLLAKLGKKTTKPEKAHSLASKPPQTSIGPVTSGEKIKYEGDSSSEEESSSEDDDDSSYTSDEEAESSPLPAKRPQSPKEATEYDTIKALWRGKRRDLSSESIRKGLGDFWDIVKTIRDRWKTDVAAVADAKSNNRVKELPLLESRVKDQRDMMEVAFKAALKYGHRGIIELSAQNAALVYLCYQFLLDREKTGDYNCALSRVMLETMTLFKGLTEDLLEKTHLIKVLVRYVKKGDAKTQFFAKRITSNAATATKERASETTGRTSAVKESNAPSPTVKHTEPAAVAGIKRAASTAADGGPPKKIATAGTKANGIIAPKQTGTLKKPGASSESAKPTIVPVTKTKTVVAKPSGLFSTLQSAAKKPGTSIMAKANQSATPSVGSRAAEKTGTSSVQNSAPRSTFSFAETMANLSKPKEEKPTAKLEKQTPPETAEQKAKRLRKEARRQLHVSFKTGEDLVQVHVFHHDPEEELGHDASQVRDVSDVGGEGRMFKQQHHMMDVDEDDETAEESMKLIEYHSPKEIDFSNVDAEERERNFAPFGGGKLEPDSAERAVREYHEANTLIVFYADAKDIPPNPREPSDPYNGKPADKVKIFGAPEEKYAARAKQRRIGQTQQSKPAQPSGTAGNLAQGLDLSKLSSFMSSPQYQQPNTYQPAPSSNDAISNILASLKQSVPNQATPPPSLMGGYGNPYPGAPPVPNIGQPQQPTMQASGQPDLAAILAQITQNQPGATRPPATGSYSYNPPSMIPFQPQMQQPTMFENPERAQWREGGGGSNGTWGNPQTQNPALNPYYRTKVCKYWQEGKCQKGDQCSYKHDNS